MKKYFTIGLISFIVVFAVIGILSSQEAPEDLELGARSTTREWVYTRSSNLVRSLTNTLSTLISGSGQTATTSDVVLEVVGASLFRGTVTATSTFNLTGDLLASSSIAFDGELLPDNLTCSNGQILKRTGPNNWDCAADNDSGGAIGQQSWEQIFTSPNTLTPTSSPPTGVFVTGSSTIDSTLRVNGTATFNGVVAVNGDSITSDGILVIDATSETSFNDENISNVGQITLDTITSDGNDITITPTNNTIFTSATKVLIGHTSALQISNNSPFQIAGTSGALASMSMSRWSNSASGVASYNVFKSRSGTIGVNTIVQDNDRIGQFKFLADDGADFDTQIAVFSAEVDDANPATGVIGGAFVFATGDGTNATPVEAMRINTSQNLGIATTTGGGQFGEILTVNGLVYFEDELRVNATTTFIVGDVIIGTTTPVGIPDAALTVQANSADEIGVHIQGFTSQTANLFEISNDVEDELFTVSIAGETEIFHTATEDGDHTLHLETTAAGFGDVVGIFSDYDADALAAGEDASNILLTIDRRNTTGGDIHGILVVTTAGSADVTALEVGAQVNPIAHRSGTFGDMDSCTQSPGLTDILSSCISGASDVTLFPNNTDQFVIGDADKFSSIDIDLATNSNKSIDATFEFSTGNDAWTFFNPTDGTDGFQDSSRIVWEFTDVPTWAVGTSTRFYIRITRTRAGNIATLPVENLIQISAITDFGWNLDGDLNVRNATTTGHLIVGVTVPTVELGVGDLFVGDKAVIVGALHASSTVLIQPTTDSVTAIQVLDQDGGTSILTIDTTNEKLIIGGDLELLADGSINKPSGNMQFDVVSAGLFKFGEGGTDGIQIDANIGRIRGAASNNFIDLTAAEWRTSSANINFDPAIGAAGTLILGDTGDNDIIHVEHILGVALATPGATLHVSGNSIYASATTSKLTIGGTSFIDDFGLYVATTTLIQPTTDSVTAIQFLDTDGGTPILNIDTVNERVGIGTAAPTETLDIEGEVSIQGTSASGNLFLNNDGSSGPLLASHIDSSGNSTFNQFGSRWLAGGSGHQFSTSDKIDVGNARTFTLRLLIATDSGAVTAGDVAIGGNIQLGGADPYFGTRLLVKGTGNVGVGTTSPDHLLHVGSGGLCIDNATGDCGSMTEGTGSATTTGSLWVVGDARIVGTLDSSDQQYTNPKTGVTIMTQTEDGEDLVWLNRDKEEVMRLTQDGSLIIKNGIEVQPQKTNYLWLLGLLGLVGLVPRKKKI